LGQREGMATANARVPLLVDWLLLTFDPSPGGCRAVYVYMCKGDAPRDGARGEGVELGAFVQDPPRAEALGLSRRSTMHMSARKDRGLRQADRPSSYISGRASAHRQS